MDNMLEQLMELRKVLHVLLPVYDKEYNSRTGKERNAEGQGWGIVHRASDLSPGLPPSQNLNVFTIWKL